MVANTGRQVAEVQNVLDACQGMDRPRFNQALVNLEKVLGDINVMMDTMWGRSYHADYMKVFPLVFLFPFNGPVYFVFLSFLVLLTLICFSIFDIFWQFRTFIMGTKNQPMFPNGVVYEGVSEEPTFYRGESGANDSIIPTCDNLLELTRHMPSNPLTEILKDFRTYRPEHHSAWLNYVDTEARSSRVRDYSMQDAETAVLYLANVDRVREFRMRHWNFTKEYILKHT